MWFKVSLNMPFSVKLSPRLGSPPWCLTVSFGDGLFWQWSLICWQIVPPLRPRRLLDQVAVGFVSEWRHRKALSGRLRNVPLPTQWEGTPRSHLLQPGAHGQPSGVPTMAGRGQQRPALHHQANGRAGRGWAARPAPPG